MEQNRVYLKQEFRDGERPSGKDFEDFIDSYINKKEDGVSLESINKNLNIPAGISLGDSPAGKAGTLRFNAGKVQVSDGVNWKDVGGAAGGTDFVLVGAGPGIAYSAGNVGIGAFATGPNYKLEVPLAANVIGNEGQRVRFGNAAISNGIGAFQTSAQFAHANMGNDNSSFALRQNPAGETRINAPVGQSVLITHGGTTVDVNILANGSMAIGGTSAAGTEKLQVNGSACKTDGPSWSNFSDGRFKKDVRDFNDGLEKLLQVRPVLFKYEGLPGIANTDKEQVGIIGQEIQQIFPYMVSTTPLNDDLKEKTGANEILMYNSGALTYVMVNAIQELAQQVKDLQKQLEQKAAQA
jgi:hypothetical protein